MCHSGTARCSTSGATGAAGPTRSLSGQRPPYATREENRLSFRSWLNGPLTQGSLPCKPLVCLTLGRACCCVAAIVTILSGTIRPAVLRAQEANPGSSAPSDTSDIAPAPSTWKGAFTDSLRLLL